MFWTVSSLLISLFPYLPTEYGEHTALVCAGAAALILGALGVASSSSSSFFSGSDAPLMPKAALLLDAAPTALAAAAVWLTMGYLESKTKPPVALTVANWLLAGLPMLALLKDILVASSSTTTMANEEAAPLARLLRRLVRVMLALAPLYVLLSISYEVFFYVALCAALLSWVLMEQSLLNLNARHDGPTSTTSTTLNEFRTSFFFLLFIKIAFFGTGNVASMSSFEISSTYRFVTVFAPFLMGFLLVTKILIPFGRKNS